MPYLNNPDFDAAHALLRILQPSHPEVDAVLATFDAAVSNEASPGLRELANDIHGCDEVEIDDERMGTSPAEGEGTWVQAWVWVSHDQLVEAGLAEDVEDDDA